MNQKLIVGILVVFVLAVIGVFGWKIVSAPQSARMTQNIEQPAETNTDEVESVKNLVDGEYSFVSVDASDWQIYRDEEAGFEIKIPKNFEKTDQGFTPKNPAVGNPESIENNIWFLIGINSRLKQKNLDSISQKDLLDPLWSQSVATGNVDVFEKRARVNNMPMILIKSLFGKEPSTNNFGGWIEGAYEEESFFECGYNVCSIRISSHQFSQEKQVLFYTILSTLHQVK
jgi:hypothetical protein